ncbi:MAG: hypothetical protein GEV28_14965 [Actinophytocola sp.]|nr:hypothetical protein [Actinophytocola sp.]
MHCGPWASSSSAACSTSSCDVASRSCVTGSTSVPSSSVRLAMVVNGVAHSTSEQAGGA